MRLLLLFPGTVIAQSTLGTTTSDTLHGAAWHALYTTTRAAHLAGRYQEANSGWSRLIAALPFDASLWVNRGYAYRALGNHRQAALAFGHAARLGTRAPQHTAFEAARMWATVNERDSTITWLERAVALHLEQRSDLVADPVFDAVRDDPRVRRLFTGLETLPATRNAGWRHDIAWLQAEAARHHFAARKGGLPRTFLSRAKQLRESVPRLSDAQIAVRIQRLLATLGDGHSLLYKMGPRALPQLPLGVYAFSDGVFIVRTTDSLRSLLGAKILAIGTVPIDAVPERILPVLSRDNDLDFRRSGTFWMLMPAVLHDAGIVTSADSVPLRLRLRDGREVVITLAAGHAARPMKRLPSPSMAGSPARYLSRADEPYWFEELPGRASLYVQFNSVEDAPGESLAAFSRRLGAAARDSAIRNLIIDVRHNSDGNEMLLPPLLRTVAAFVESDPRRHVVVIQGRATFSAAQVFISHIDRFVGATFAGEPSGSSPNFVGEDAAVRLPFSGLVASISTRYHQVDDQDQRPFIPSRVPVVLSSADYFANRDPVLDEVLVMLSRR